MARKVHIDCSEADLDAVVIEVERGWTDEVDLQPRDFRYVNPHRDRNREQHVVIAD